MTTCELQTANGGRKKKRKNRKFCTNRRLPVSAQMGWPKLEVWHVYRVPFFIQQKSLFLQFHSCACPSHVDMEARLEVKQATPVCFVHGTDVLSNNQNPGQPSSPPPTTSLLLSHTYVKVTYLCYPAFFLSLPFLN